MVWVSVLALNVLALLFHAVSEPPPSLSVCFTPGQPCTDEIVHQIISAKKSIYVQAYSFTSLPIAIALVDAAHRGVKVALIADKRGPTERNGQYPLLVANIPVSIDRSVRIAHNKVMIIDGQEVITGSFNFTKAAQENNAENVVFIRSSEIAKEYLANWERRQQVSSPAAAHAPARNQ